MISQLTTALLPPETAKLLVAKAAECVRGIDLLDRIIGSQELLQTISQRCGTDLASIQRMLDMKRGELVARREAMAAPLSAPKGFTLQIEIDGLRVSIG